MKVYTKTLLFLSTTENKCQKLKLHFRLKLQISFSQFIESWTRLTSTTQMGLLDKKRYIFLY